MVLDGDDCWKGKVGRMKLPNTKVLEKFNGWKTRPELVDAFPGVARQRVGPLSFELTSTGSLIFQEQGASGTE